MAEMTRRSACLPSETCADCGAPIPADEPLRQLAGLGEFCSDACVAAAFGKAVPYVMHL